MQEQALLVNLMGDDVFQDMDGKIQGAMRSVERCTARHTEGKSFVNEIKLKEMVHCLKKAEGLHAMCVQNLQDLQSRQSTFAQQRNEAVLTFSELPLEVALIVDSYDSDISQGIEAMMNIEKNVATAKVNIEHGFAHVVLYKVSRIFKWVSCFTCGFRCCVVPVSRCVARCWKM